MTAAEKEMKRLLRLASRGTCSLRQGASPARMILEAADGMAVAVSRTAVERAARTGLARRAGGRLELTEAGRAACRAAAPEPTSESAERAMVEIEGPYGRDRVTINLAESPLSQVARLKDRNGRSFLSRDEIEAGERLRANFTRGSLMQRLGIDWDAPVVGGRSAGTRGGMADLTDAAIEARKRVEAAIVAVGPELSGVLLDICCFLKGLEQVERERSWPVRSGKLMLRTALAALARHYRPPAGRRSVVLHWGVEGYRPTLG